MSDHIFVQRIAIYAYHGLNPEEEKLGQRFFVSLDCELDTSTAGRNDDWNSTVCYGQMTEVVTRLGTNGRFHIIEALAEAVAQELLARFPRLEQVTVEVEKPSAPVPAIIDGVSVRITRRRHG
jgi:dihydroneopterin aldolase